MICKLKKINFSVVLATLVLCALYLAVAQIPAFAQDYSAPVEVDEVRTESILETAAVFGELVSRQSGYIQVAINGPVGSLKVRVGDRVNKDDLIATVDATALELQKNAVLTRITMSEWATRRRMTELDLSAQKEERFRELRHSAGSTEAQLEDAELALKIAQHAVGESKAATEQIYSELAISEHNLSLTNITAPYGGVIVERLVELGQYLRVGDRVVRIVGDHDLEIEAYIPYRYIDALNVGDIITAEFDNGTTFSATLRAFIPEEHVSTRTRAVRFEFDRSTINDVLAVKQNVIINIPVSSQKDALTVHKDSIMTNPEGHSVFVVNGDSVMAQPVNIGQATGGRYEVLSGLESGDIVVVRGNERLVPGQKVTVVN